MPASISSFGPERQRNAGPWPLRVDIVEVGGRDLGVPQSRGIVVRSGDNTSTVGTEGRAIHLIRMMRKRGHGGARRGVPDACGWVSDIHKQSTATVS